MSLFSVYTVDIIKASNCTKTFGAGTPFVYFHIYAYIYMFFSIILLVHRCVSRESREAPEESNRTRIILPVTA